MQQASENPPHAAKLAQDIDRCVGPNEQCGLRAVCVDEQPDAVDGRRAVRLHCCASVFAAERCEAEPGRCVVSQNEFDGAIAERTDAVVQQHVFALRDLLRRQGRLQRPGCTPGQPILFIDDIDS